MSILDQSHVCDLLLVDDDLQQLRLLELSLQELRLPLRCHFVPNGDGALAFLERLPPYQDAPRPQLILMDLNLPGMNGCEVLRSIKSNPAIAAIPVIILSTSDSSEAVSECYYNHANAYITKPHDFFTSLDMVRTLHRFWFKTAVLSP